MAHPTSHCQYSLTYPAALDLLKKDVLVHQAAELDEMNGGTWTVDSDPKQSEAPTTKALQFQLAVTWLGNPRNSFFHFWGVLSGILLSFFSISNTAATSLIQTLISVVPVQLIPPYSQPSLKTSLSVTGGL